MSPKLGLNDLVELKLFKTSELLGKMRGLSSARYMMLQSNDRNSETFFLSSVNGAKIFQEREVKYSKSKLHKVTVSQVNTIILHTTKAKNIPAAIELYHNFGVSAHFIIDTDGIVYLLIPVEFMAFHAGTSSFKNLNKIGIPNYGIEQVKSLNPVTIGVEILTPDGNIVTYTQEQSLQILIDNLLEIYPNIKNIISHSTIAPTRKLDPSCIALMCINRDNFADLTSFPKKASPALHRELMDFFHLRSQINSEKITEITSILDGVGYDMQCSDSANFPLLLAGALADYVKHISPEEYLKSSVFTDNLAKIITHPVFIYYETNTYNAKKMPQILQIKYPSSVNIMKQIDIISSDEFHGILQQMDLDRDFLECVENVSTELAIVKKLVKEINKIQVNYST